MEQHGFGLVVAIFMIAVTVIVLWRNRNKRKPKLEQRPAKWHLLKSVDNDGTLARTLIVHWLVRLKPGSAPFYSYRIDRQQGAEHMPLNLIPSDHMNDRGRVVELLQQGNQLDTDVKAGPVVYHLYGLARTNMHPVSVASVNMVVQPRVVAAASSRRHTDVAGAPT